MTNILRQVNTEMASVVEEARQSLVQISNGKGGVGSGTIWQADGLIITNAHVVQGRQKDLMVTLANGQTFPARVLASDKQHDLAALSIEATNLPTITVGKSQTLMPGEWVLGIGYPWGVAGAVTAGAVIDVGNTIEGRFPHGELIQVGLHLRPGHSGGPLVDVQGRLVGISTMINGPDVGLCIPIDVVKAFVGQTLGSAQRQPPKPSAQPMYI